MAFSEEIRFVLTSRKILEWASELQTSRKKVITWVMFSLDQ